MMMCRDLYDNQISSLEAGAFADLGNLVTLCVGVCIVCVCMGGFDLVFVIVRVECEICGCDVILEREYSLLVIVDVCCEDSCGKV